MAKLRPDIEWAPQSPNSWTRFGMRKRADNKWEVVSNKDWLDDDGYEVEVVVDSRNAAIGFIKLLRGELYEY